METTYCTTLFKSHEFGINQVGLLLKTTCLLVKSVLFPPSC